MMQALWVCFVKLQELLAVRTSCSKAKVVARFERAVSRSLEVETLIKLFLQRR